MPQSLGLDETRQARRAMWPTRTTTQDASHRPVCESRTTTQDASHRPVCECISNIPFYIHAADISTYWPSHASVQHSHENTQININKLINASTNKLINIFTNMQTHKFRYVMTLLGSRNIIFHNAVKLRHLYSTILAHSFRGTCYMLCARSTGS